METPGDDGDQRGHLVRFPDLNGSWQSLAGRLPLRGLAIAIVALIVLFGSVYTIDPEEIGGRGALRPVRAGRRTPGCTSSCPSASSA